MYEIVNYPPEGVYERAKAKWGVSFDNIIQRVNVWAFDITYWDNVNDVYISDIHWSSSTGNLAIYFEWIEYLHDTNILLTVQRDFIIDRLQYLTSHPPEWNG